jgi:hypothetical protein
MSNQTFVEEEQRHTVSQYVHALDRMGTRTFASSGNSFWIRYENSALLRMPTFYSASPLNREIRRILWAARAPVASYVVEPDEHRPANAWLYTCDDSNYCVEKLPKAAQRCVRRAQRTLSFGRIDLPTLLAGGFTAYAETRARVGLSDGTREQFERRFKSFGQNPCHQIFGAWAEQKLVAFMALIVVDDWVEIPGSFSANTHLDLRPNDGLVNHILDLFLVRHRFRVVSYGLSSVQEDAETAGLHAFKQKVGFKAEAVHRAFVLHPLLDPFANRLTAWGAKTLLRCYPKSRLLRKASGVLSISTVNSSQKQMRDEFAYLIRKM